MPHSNGAKTNSEMDSLIRAGNVISYRGRLLTSTSQVPPDATIIAETDADNAARAANDSSVTTLAADITDKLDQMHRLGARHPMER